MKNGILLLTMTLVCFLALPLHAQQSDSTGETIATGLGRGMVNIVTSVVELPRNVVYDSSDYGTLGFFSGLGKGLAYTCGRMGCGLSDILTLGFLPENNNLYQAFGMDYYVWDEPWTVRMGWHAPRRVPYAQRTE